MVSRTRVTDSTVAQTSAPYEARWNYCSEPDFVIYGYRQRYLRGSYKSTTDTVTENYVARRKAGEIIMNPFSSTNYNLNPSFGTGPWLQANAGMTCSGVLRKWEGRIGTGCLDDFYCKAKFGPTGSPSQSVHTPAIDNVLTSTETNRAISEAVTEMRSKRGTFADSNMYETVAEIKKTMAMLDAITREMNTVIHGAHARVRKKYSRSPRAVALSNLWLLYRYGLLPLMSSADTVIKGLQKSIGKRRITSRGSCSLSTASTRQFSYTWGSLCTCTIDETVTDTCEVRAMSLDEAVLSLADNIGFSTKNLATLPWELVPYSFVVDWFVNVGDFIGALIPSPSLVQLGQVYTVKRTLNMKVTPAATTPLSGYTLLRPLSGYIDVTRVYKNRYLDVPGPALIIKPDFGFDKHTRVLDALALIVQKL